MINSITRRNTMSCYTFILRHQKPGFLYLQGCNVAETVWKNRQTLADKPPLNRDRLGWNCFGATGHFPEVQNVKSNFDLQSELGMLGEKQPLAVPGGISFNIQEKQGSNLLHFWPYNLSSRWYHPKSRKKKAFLWDVIPHVLRRW